MKTLNCWLISCLEVLSAILFLIFWGVIIAASTDKIDGWMARKYNQK